VDFGLTNQTRCEGSGMQNVNVQPTLMERLKGRRASAQATLDEIDGLIASLEKYPDMEKVLTSLSRLF
jgi:hypothetical protein